MSGETEKEVSGWTVDTLHAHTDTNLTSVKLALALQIETTTVNLQQQLDDLRIMLNERYATQVKAVDAAFLAQQTAMQTALSAAEKAVETALLSAEKAVAKAELAADKRFEAVNGFRAQLADQAASFMPRTESDTKFEAISEKLDTASRRSAERITVLESRANLRDGELIGTRHLTADQRATNQVMIGVGSVILVALSIAVTLILALNG